MSRSSIAAAIGTTWFLTALAACIGDDDDLQLSTPNADASVGSSSSSGAVDLPDAEDGSFRLEFRAQVGELPFSCDDTYALGSRATESSIRDARLFVSNVELIDEAGSRVPFALETTPWQTSRVALLDFEDGTGGCRNGTPETNMALVGTAPPGNYRGLTFTIGVPEQDNHGDPSTASSPLTGSTMHWSWNAGYIFLRIDAERRIDDGDGDGGMNHGDGGMSHGDGGMSHGDGGMSHGDGGMNHGPNGVYLMHLGSAGCTGEAASGESVRCSHANRGAIELDAIDLQKPIVVDLGAVFAASDLEADDLGGSPGCMASPDDPECQTLLPRVGVDAANGGPSPSTQVLFRGAR